MKTVLSDFSWPKFISLDLETIFSKYEAVFWTWGFSQNSTSVLNLSVIFEFGHHSQTKVLFSCQIAIWSSFVEVVSFLPYARAEKVTLGVFSKILSFVHSVLNKYLSILCCHAAILNWVELLWTEGNGIDGSEFESTAESSISPELTPMIVTLFNQLHSRKNFIRFLKIIERLGSHWKLDESEC